MNLKNRIWNVIHGEDGFASLEIAIIIVVVCYITFRVLVFFNSLLALQITRNEYTSSTGWIRNYKGVTK